jgi:hypothetical protein
VANLIHHITSARQQKCLLSIFPPSFVVGTFVYAPFFGLLIFFIFLGLD